MRGKYGNEGKKWQRGENMAMKEKYDDEGEIWL